MAELIAGLRDWSERVRATDQEFQDKLAKGHKLNPGEEREYAGHCLERICIAEIDTALAQFDLKARKVLK